MIIAKPRPVNATRNNPFAIGLLWTLWRRQRYLIAGWAAYLCLASIVIRKISSHPELYLYLFLPLLLGLVSMIVLYSVDGSSDFRSSSYPPYLLVAPIETRTLALWPMLFGAVLMAAAWYALNWLIVIPLHWRLFPIWSPLTFVAVSVWLQTLSWTPFLYRRPLLVLLILSAAVAVFAFCPAIPPGYVLIPLICIAFPIAISGLSSLRRGDADDGDSDQDWLEKLLRSMAPPLAQTPSGETFNSTISAQYWFEWTRAGYLSAFGSIVFVGCLGYMLPTVLALMQDILAAIPTPFVRPYSPFIETLHIVAHYEVFLDGRFMPLLFIPFVPFLISIFREKDRLDDTDSLGRFFASRPVVNSDIIAAKCYLQLRASIYSLPFIFILLLFPSEFGSAHGMLGLLLLEHAQWMTLIRINFWGLILVYVTFKLATDYLWFNVMPNEWNRVLLGALLCSLFATALLPPVWKFAHVEGLPLLYHVIKIMTIVKLILLPIAIHQLLRRRLIDRTKLPNIAFIWRLSAAVAIAIAVSLVPAQLVSPWITASVIILLMPGVRLAIAPILYDYNRHR